MKDDSDVHEYARELTDGELVGLTVDVARRGQALLSQGVALDMAGIVNHHLLGLLEAIAGPEVSLRVKEWHVSWLDRYLDAAEAQARAAMLGNLDVLGNGERLNGARS